MSDPDHGEVADVLARYGQLLDRRQTSAWLELFTGDAVLIITGRPEALATEDARRQLADTCPTGVHIGNQPLIQVDGDAASATQTFLYWNLDTASAVGGWYDDELRHDPDGWRFVRRTIHFFESSSPRGG